MTDDGVKGMNTLWHNVLINPSLMCYGPPLCTVDREHAQTMLLFITLLGNMHVCC